MPGALSVRETRSDSSIEGFARVPAGGDANPEYQLENTVGSEVVKLLPPLTIDEEDLRDGIARLTDSLTIALGRIDPYQSPLMVKHNN